MQKCGVYFYLYLVKLAMGHKKESISQKKNILIEIPLGKRGDLFIFSSNVDSIFKTQEHQWAKGLPHLISIPRNIFLSQAPLKNTSAGSPVPPGSAACTVHCKVCSVQ